MKKCTRREYFSNMMLASAGAMACPLIGRADNKKIIDTQVTAMADDTARAYQKLRITDVETIRFFIDKEEHNSKWLKLRESRGILGGFKMKKKKGHDMRSLTIIRTNQGIEGYAPGGNADKINAIRDVLLNENPLDRDRLWFNVFEKTKTDKNTHAAIDCALWDLYGRVAKLPVHKLMGGGRDEVPAYASTLSDVGTYDEWAQHALECKQRGYKAYKIHPYYCMHPETLEVHPDRRSYAEYDIEMCKAVRKAVGDDMILMLDPHGNYRSVKEALMVGKAIERLNFYWYEVPMSEDSTEDYAFLRRQLDIPIVGPEWSHGTYYKRAQWIRDAASDISRIDVHHRGITACIKSMHMAEAFGMRTELHTGGWSHINLAAGFTARTIEFYERFVPDPFYERVKDPWVKHGESYEPMDTNGMVKPPVRPGLGFEVDWDYVEAHRI